MKVISVLKPNQLGQVGVPGSCIGPLEGLLVVLKGLNDRFSRCQTSIPRALSLRKYILTFIIETLSGSA